MAALLQIPSTLLFTLEESVGSLWTIDLHAATASATPAAELGTLEDGVEAVVDVVEVALVATVLALAVVVLAGVLVEVEFELLLPQPASSAPASSASRKENRVAIICPPMGSKNTQGFARSELL